MMKLLDILILLIGWVIGAAVLIGLGTVIAWVGLRLI
jgi:hypothetical protein